MKRSSKLRGQWNWLFRRNACPAVLQQLENGTWSVPIDGTVIGTAASERAAVELVHRHDGKGGA